MIILEDDVDQLADQLRVKYQEYFGTFRKTEKEVYGELLAKEKMGIDVTIKSKSGESEKEFYSDYSVIFEQLKLASCSSDAFSRIKILIQGHPGTGKSTFMRKIVYDWTNGIFETCKLIIFLSLKFTNPKHTIGSAFIQHYELEDSLSSEQLSNILKVFGDKCLIICDGLDQHDVKGNSDLTDILNDKRLERCNFIFTITTNLAKTVEENCDTVVTLKGVKKVAAKTYISTNLKHSITKDKIQSILDFKFFLLDKPLEVIACPMLLKNLCFLLCEREIALDEEITLGKICYKLVLCLYTNSKTSKSKGKTSNTRNQQTEDECEQYLVKLGKFALENLWLKKLMIEEDVKKELGEYYDIIRGLISKPPGSQYIVFDHSTIQQFFGAYYIIHSLKEYTLHRKEEKHDCLIVGEFVDMNMRAFYQSSPLMRRNPYLFEFCNWVSKMLNFGSEWKEWVQEPAGLLHLL